MGPSDPPASPLLHPRCGVTELGLPEGIRASCADSEPGHSSGSSGNKAAFAEAAALPTSDLGPGSWGGAGGSAASALTSHQAKMVPGSPRTPARAGRRPRGVPAAPALSSLTLLCRTVCETQLRRFSRPSSRRGGLWDVTPSGASGGVNLPPPAPDPVSLLRSGVLGPWPRLPA